MELSWLGATVDGRRAALLPANVALQALWLPAGAHQVELRYLPLEVYAGLVISLVTVAGALILARYRHLSRVEPAIAAGAVGRGWAPAPTPAEVARPALSGRTRLALLALVVLLGFGLRLYRLGYQELRGDEGYSYPFTTIPVAELLPELARLDEEHSPLHYLLLVTWTGLVGDSEFAMRFPALVPGVLTLPLLYHLGRGFGGRRGGLLLAGLGALAPSLVWQSQDVRNVYSLAILFGSLATLLLLRIVKSEGRDPGATRMARAGSWLLYALAAALTVYGHYYGVFALLAHGIYLITAASRRRLLPRWIGAGFVAALLFLPWIASTYQGVLGQLSQPGEIELARHLTEIGVELGTGATLPTSLGRWIFLGGLALAVIGLLDLFKRRPGHGWLFAGWLAVAALLTFLIRSQRSGIFNAYYVIPAAPAWLALVTAGLLRLRRLPGDQGRMVAGLALGGLVMSSAVGLVNYYFDPAYSRSNGYREVAAYLAANADPDDLLIAPFPDPALSYYLRHVEVAQTLAPERPGMSTAEIEASLAGLAGEHERLWLVPYGPTEWDPQDVVFRWLDYHGMLEEKLAFSRLTLAAYRPAHAAPAAAQQVGARLNDRLTLEGIYLTAGGHPVDLKANPITMPAGETLLVTLLWRAERAMAEDYTAFVHLAAPDGWLLAQHDGVAAFGTRPTSTWRAGELILDRHELQLPPAIEGGPARLLVGLYDTTTMERQIFVGQGDAVLIAEVELGP
jgi:mannosyltransferase